MIRWRPPPTPVGGAGTIDAIGQYLGQLTAYGSLNMSAPFAHYDLHIEIVRPVASPAGFRVWREILRYFAIRRKVIRPR